MTAARRAREKRIDTISALVLSMGFSSDITDEYLAVKTVETHPVVKRRRLLQVLHATRALDSCLRATTVRAGCLPAKNAQKSLGGYLRALRDGPVFAPCVNKLPALSVTNYQSAIVNVRNRFMHEAGAYPLTDAEIGLLLANMEACVGEVFAL